MTFNQKLIYNVLNDYITHNPPGTKVKGDTKEFTCDITYRFFMAQFQLFKSRVIFTSMLHVNMRLTSMTVNQKPFYNLLNDLIAHNPPGTKVTGDTKGFTCDITYRLFMAQC